MSRWIAAILVTITAFAFAAAQDSGEKPLRFPFGGSKSQIPFDVVEVDGQSAWRVSGRGSVKIEELIAGYTSATGKRVSYDMQASNLARETVPYVGPDSGMVVAHAELGDYVSGLIQARGLTLVGHSGEKVRVVTVQAALAYARVIEPSELAGLPESEWATIARSDIAADTYALRSALEPASAGGVWISSEGDLFVVTGRVEQLRNINRIVEKFEGATASNGREIRVYDLGANLKANDAIGVINSLFEEPGKKIQDFDGRFSVVSEDLSRVNAAAAPTGNRVIVRASAGDHALVKAALLALK